MTRKAVFVSMVGNRVGRPGSHLASALVWGGVLALVLFSVTGASAQVCGEAIVNTAYTASNQSFASVAADPSTGDFMVVWQSNGSVGADPGEGVLGQRFASDGSPLGANFVVNEETIRAQRVPKIVFEPEADEFVVVWLSAQAGDEPIDPVNQVFGRRFDTAGSPIGGEFRIDEDLIPDMLIPKNGVGLADLPTGELVVTWSTYSPSGGTDDSLFSVWARRIDSTGVGVGGQFQVNITTLDSQRLGSIAADPTTGEFVVAWQDFGQRQQVLRRFDASANGLGGELVIDPGESYSGSPEIAADTVNGGFRVVWTRRSAGSLDTNILTRRLDSTGSWVGSPMQVNAPVDADQLSPSISVEPTTGAFWIAWTEYLGGTGTEGLVNVRTRRFDSSDMPTTAPTRINTGMFESTNGARVAFLPSVSSPGTYEPIVTWHGRPLPPDPVALTDVNLAVGQSIFETGCPLLVDGFETGDTTNWSTEQ